MIDLNQAKVPPATRVWNLFVQGCSNREIASRLNISPRPPHGEAPLRTLILRADLAGSNPRGSQAPENGYRHVHEAGSTVMTPCERLTSKEIMR